MKILVVDDHVLIREALRAILGELDDKAVLIEAADARQAARCMAGHPDLELILLDLSLPDRDGFELLAEWHVRCPTVSVVVLSASRDRDDIVRALDLGASGFVPKSASRDVMLRAFELIFAGGVYVPPEALDRPRPPAHTDSLPPAFELGITERQREVLALMMQGKSNKVICRELDIAEATVKNHITPILKALKASSRTEAVIFAGALAPASSRRRG